MNAVSRRNYVEKLTPTELLIRDAIISVEKLWASTELSNAVWLLIQAQNIVSDFIDKDIS